MNADGFAYLTLIRPTIVHDMHLEFLDELRESGDTNMFGASPYIREAFDVTKAEAATILTYWMKTFPREERD